MLVLYRKSGQGIQVKNSVNGELFDFDFLFNDGDQSSYRVNGVKESRSAGAPFYLDANCEIMVVIINAEDAIRVGVDAPRHFKIRRKELPFT